MRHTTLLIGTLLVSLAPSAAAQQCGSVSLTTFTGSTNEGNWGFGGPNEFIQPGGGFPGEELISVWLDTFAPQLSTSGTSPFVGSYRADQVTSLGVDLRTYQIDFPSCPRPLSLVLTHFNSTPFDPSDDFFVYYVGSESIPCPDGLWHSYHFDVPSQSTTLPAGWALDPNSVLAPNVAWNMIMQRVDRVTFFYGDPTNFFIFQQWTVGADNLRISRNGAVSTYCISKKNSVGCQPAISANASQPSVSQSSGFVLSTAQVINNKSGILFYGHGAQNSPFQGGALCVTLPIQRTLVANSGGNPPPDNCSGTLSIDFNGWIAAGGDPSLVAGAEIFAQTWSRDPASPSTTSLSNAIRFTICL